MRRDRNEIFTAEYTKVGMATGNHASQGTMQVMGFAQEYSNLDLPLIAEKLPGYPWTDDELSISFMEADCSQISLTDNLNSISVTCTLPTDSANADKVSAIAGDWLPKVHFEGIGYAKTTGLP